MADFAYQHTVEFLHWRENSNYIIALECENETELEQWGEILTNNQLTIVPVTEPDINYQLTAILVHPNEGVSNLLKKLPTLSRNDKRQNNVSILKQQLTKTTPNEWNN